mmetsp:Transcript_17982/g.25897  ORF Transcript_17982/g.25897 Transcript_17982/m.25897 type:complete len:464 (-) Transcript_17982:1695-3086(-)
MARFLNCTLFFTKFVIVTDPEIIREILLKRPKTFRRSSLADMPSVIAGLNNALFFSEASLWSRSRRLTSPAFNKKSVSDMSACVWNEINKFADQLAEKVNKSDGTTVDIDMKDNLAILTVKVLSAVAFGGSNLPKEVTEYCESSLLMKDLKNIFSFLINMTLFPLPFIFWKWSPLYYTLELPAVKSTKRMQSICMKIVQSHKERALTADFSKPSGHRSLIESLLRSTGQEQLTDDEIVQNTKGFLIAGTDTTSVALTWTLYYLSLTPQWLTILREEVDSFYSALAIFESDRKDDNEAALSQFLTESVHTRLPLCVATLKETIRLASPASFLGIQTIDSPVTLSNGLRIETTDTLFLHTDSCVWDPKVFEDPMEFIPERWTASSLLSTEQRQAMDASFLAFGSGPRQCPGMGLVMDLEGPLAIAMLVRRFDFQLSVPKEEIRRVLNFTSEPNKMPMHLRRRLID